MFPDGNTLKPVGECFHLLGSKEKEERDECKERFGKRKRLVAQYLAECATYLAGSIQTKS